jgi:hypothetical protein
MGYWKLVTNSKPAACANGSGGPNSNGDGDGGAIEPYQAALPP